MYVKYSVFTGISDRSLSSKARISTILTLTTKKCAGHCTIILFGRNRIFLYVGTATTNSFLQWSSSISVWNNYQIEKLAFEFFLLFVSCFLKFVSVLVL